LYFEIIRYVVGMHLLFPDELASFHEASTLENFNQKTLGNIRVHITHIPSQQIIITRNQILRKKNIVEKQKYRIHIKQPYSYDAITTM
jgi:hypothetical protein